MITKDQALTLMKAGLAASTADQTELVLIGEDLSLTRFAESTIHQNMYRSDTTIYARAIKDKKIGISSTEIRDRVRMGKSIRYWVPRAVETFILEKGLYRQ